MSAPALLASSPPAAAWVHLWSVFGVSLTGLLALGWLWRTVWARVERCAPSRRACSRGKHEVARRALIVGGVFVISAALTFAR